MLKYLCNPLLYIPSLCSNLICFKVQMTLGVQLGLDTQWINLRRIWIILINLCYFSTKQDFWDYFNVINVWHCYVSNLDGPQNRAIKFNMFQGYPHMDHCIGCHTCAVTVAYAVLWLEVLLHYSAMKVSYLHIKCATRGGGRPPLLFLENQKSTLIVEKKALILSILRLNLPLKT